jgi:hypothetical protein
LTIRDADLGGEVADTESEINHGDWLALNVRSTAPDSPRIDAATPAGVREINAHLRRELSRNPRSVAGPGIQFAQPPALELSR